MSERPRRSLLAEAPEGVRFELHLKQELSVEVKEITKTIKLSVSLKLIFSHNIRVG